MATNGAGNKIAFALGSNKRKRKAPTQTAAAASAFETDAFNKQNDEEHAAVRTEPLVIPLKNEDKRTLLERKQAERKQQKTQDEIAAEALTQSAAAHFSGQLQKAETTNFSASGSLIISSGQNTNLAESAKSADKDKQQYQDELKALPDNVGVESDVYQRVPINEFGAALLRGMGWTGDNSSGKAPAAPSMRPHRLGLGATPKLVAMPVSGKIRTENQVKRDEKLEKQQQEYEEQRQQRVAKDKQQTLQLGSILWCEGRRAKLLQLAGVPGLNRVLVQFENDATKTPVKKGDISLVPRSNLSDRPFREVELEGEPKDEHTFMGDSKDDGRKRDKDEKKRKRSEEDRRHEPKKRKREEKKSKSREEPPSHWIISNIRVRVISKKLGSQYYKEKGIVIDVTDRGSSATLKMSNGQVLDRVPERYLETALPKAGGNAVVLVGRSKFAKGKLLERGSGKGVIQVFEDMSVLTMSLDDMAEWVGPLDDDMME